MTCRKKETCANYQQKCKECGMKSNIIKHHPMYQRKDIVEVVRCKDCIHWVSPMKDDAHYCFQKFGLVGIVAEEDFCSYGERRCE